MAAARISRRQIAGAAALSLLVHLGVVIVLVQQTRGLMGPASPPRPVEVELLRLLPPKPPPKSETAAPRPAAPPNAVSAPAPPAPVVRPTLLPPPSAAEPVPGAPPAEDAALANARAAVREGFGCDPKLMFRLTAAEQEACRRHERQYAARKGQGPGATAQLDLDGRFGKPDPDHPWLTQMPKQGCKPRVGGGGGDLASGSEYFIPGISCVFKF